MVDGPARPPNPAAGRVTDEALNRGFETAYSHLVRFGAITNAGGVAACVGFLSTTATPSGTTKAVLVPIALFVCGILCAWLTLYVVTDRIAGHLGERDENPTRPLTEKVADLLSKPYDNGALIIAPLILFCLGVAAGFVVILFA